MGPLCLACGHPMKHNFKGGNLSKDKTPTKASQEKNTCMFTACECKDYTPEKKAVSTEEVLGKREEEVRTTSVEEERNASL